MPAVPVYLYYTFYSFILFGFVMCLKKDNIFRQVNEEKFEKKDLSAENILKDVLKLKKHAADLPQTREKLLPSLEFSDLRNENLENDHYRFEQFETSLTPNTVSSFYEDIAKKFPERPKTVETFKDGDKEILDKGNNLLSVLWNLLHHGHLHQSDETNIGANTRDSLSSFRSEVVNGTGLVVASCDVTISYASLNPNNTVLSIFFDETSAMKCESKILNKNLPNVFSSITDASKVIDTYLQSHIVYFDFIFIKNFERLTDGLLPQEVEDIAAEIVTTFRSLLLSLDVESGKRLKFYKSSWKEPKDFINNICARIANGNCTNRFIEGEEKYWMPLTVAFKKSDNEMLDKCKRKGIPLQLLLSYNVTSYCKNNLFLSVLISNVDWSQKNETFVHGHKVISLQCQSHDSLSSSQSAALLTTKEMKNLNAFKNFHTRHLNLKMKDIKSTATSFDIVDGRPVEEEKKLTQGYQYLGHGEPKSNFRRRLAPVSKINTKNLSVEKKSWKQLQSPENISRKIQRETKRGEKEDMNNTIMNSILQQRNYQSTLLSGPLVTSNFGMRKLNMYREDIPTRQPFLSRFENFRINKPETSGSLTNDKFLTFYENPWYQQPTDATRNPPSRQISEAQEKSLTDESRYKLMKKALTPYLDNIFKKRQRVSGFIAGGCYLSMLSAKLSLQHPNASLITLDTDKCQRCDQKFGSVLDSSDIANNFMIRDILSPNVMYQISQIPQLFDFQVLDSDLFSWLLLMGPAFSDYFTRILTMSKVTFIKVPKWRSVKAAIELFKANRSVAKDVDSFQDLLSASLSLTGWKSLKVAKVLDITGEKMERDLFMVELQSFQKKVYTTCANGQASPATLSYNKPTATLDSSDKQSLPQKFEQDGLNMKMLLLFNLEHSHRRRLFQSYLKVPLYDDMCPCKLFWSHGQLTHMDESGTQNVELTELEHLTRLIDSEIHQSIFSFMDYSSPDKYIGSSLAHKYPHSTFILPELSLSVAKEIHKKAQRDGLNNSVVLHLPITQDYSHHLLKSPDILRYQYIDLVAIIVTTSEDNRMDAFRTIMGDLLATGLTSFILVPSAEILSLATTTIYPGLMDKNTHLISSNCPFFENAEENLLLQVADTSNLNVRLHSNLYTPLQSSLPSSRHVRVRSSWKLSTVRILYLQIQVDHHFNYELDQHSRKYIQHVERKGPFDPPNVFLTRKEDNYQIQYGNVSAISLIALLRMGLPESTREKFYSLFLQLPLQEDMAPWNIVFQGGNLTYIDQDTRDTTYDKYVPMAYQIMSVLINYERTVKDFEHCGEKARTQYGISHVASCVSSKFQGPCPDSKIPVPCGDSTCQPTYIHCLRALQSKMNESRGITLQKGEKHKKREKWHPPPKPE